MPLAPHILGAAAWFYLFVMLPLARYGHSKPRLAAQRARVDHVLDSNRRCIEITRLTHAELMQLAELLDAGDERAYGNWRFAPLQRLVIALYCLSAPLCLRRAKQQWGWAMNSISANIDYWCSVIIERLDAPGSRTCAAHHARCPPVCLPPLTRCLRVCLLRVQRTPSADGRRQSRMHGAPLLRGRPSSLTASASWTPHTSACSDPSGTRSSGGCIPRTRRRTACSSWLSWIAGVSSATDEHSIRGSSSQQSARAHQSVCLRVSVLQDASATLTRATAPRAAQSQPRSTSRATFSCREGLSLLGDVAYTADSRVKTGWRGPDIDPARVGAVLAAQRRRFNQRLSSLRIRVEHAFSRLKHTWQLLEATWSMPRDRLAPTVRACALLANYLVIERNLYMMQ
jgi:hypothetical protein